MHPYMRMDSHTYRKTQERMPNCQLIKMWAHLETEGLEVGITDKSSPIWPSPQERSHNILLRVFKRFVFAHLYPQQNHIEMNHSATNILDNIIEHLLIISNIQIHLFNSQPNIPKITYHIQYQKLQKSSGMKFPLSISKSMFSPLKFSSPKVPLTYVTVSDIFGVLINCIFSIQMQPQ